jgi:hypothetical protein
MREEHRPGEPLRDFENRRRKLVELNLRHHLIDAAAPFLGIGIPSTGEIIGVSLSAYLFSK